jgi:uncharacterized membrane protein YfcA
MLYVENLSLNLLLQVVTNKIYMEIIAFILALLMGITLGLIGGGGSILTVPILVYVLHVNPILASAYSLFVVGTTALAGSVSNIRNGSTKIPIALYFGIPSVLSIYATRAWVVPHIPHVILEIGGVSVTKETGILMLFATLMVAASISMIRPFPNRNQKENQASTLQNVNYPLLIIEGVFVGFLAGLVGAGGGFLIIPTLVFFAHLEMKDAVGTSLLIIAVQSLTGFAGDLQIGTAMNWTLILELAGIAVVGIFIGSYLTQFIEGAKLKVGFGWFVLSIGSLMIINQIFK